MIASQKKLTTIAALLACTAMQPAAVAWANRAEQAQPPRGLEEIVISARKRTETLQDVPLSVTVLSGQKLQQSGVTDLQGLSQYVPNFTFTEAVAAADQFFIRGFGSGVNAGFEMSVGQVIDGFFYGRSRYGRAAFLDVERIEVLRGPQGALIGKNTSAGAINITTNKPTEEFEGYIAPSYEFEGNEGYSVDAVLSGPLTDRLRFRVAARYENKDGWVTNLNSGKTEPTTDDFTTRATLDFDATDDLLVRLSYQYGDIHHTGRNRELSKCSANLTSTLVAQNLTGVEDCTLNNTRSSLNLDQYGTLNEEVNDTRFHIANMTLEWNHDDFTISSLTGFSRYTGLDFWDTDSLPIQVTSINNNLEYEQLSQELRIASNGNGTIDYIAGIFLQDTTQNERQQVNFYALPAPATRNINADIDSKTAAVFAQIDWNISHQLILSVGGRYTHEKKDLRHWQFGSILETEVPMAFGGGPASPTHDVTMERTENNFSPDASLQWKPTDDVMIYANVARGFKGGGFDAVFAGNQAATEAGVEFSKETVTAYELGAKFDFPEQNAQFNIATFYQKFKDLQVSSLINTQTLTFAVDNAASARSYGVEADARWRPIPELTLSAAGAYLNAKYNDFPTAQCYDGQTIAEGCVGGVQDLSGKFLQFAPKWTFTGNIDYVAELGNGYSLTPGVTISYLGKQYLSLDNSPDLIQSSYAKIDAQISLYSESGDWSLSLIGRNLTDKLTSPFANKSTAVGGVGTFFRFTDPPRQIMLRARKNF